MNYEPNANDSHLLLTNGSIDLSALRQCKTSSANSWWYRCAHYTVRNLDKSREYFWAWHAWKNSVEVKIWFLYNIYIDWKESQMTERDFFRLDQAEWFRDFVDTEVSEIRGDTNTHREFFEFDDVPF